MIDRRELLARARQRRLPLGMIEKDYVLGWALFGLMRVPGLVFKGGTALAKVYFPEAWRLSEDLDLVAAPEQWEGLADGIPEALAATTSSSGIELTVRSRHLNPGYLQLKVQYSGPLGRNWLKIDVTPDPPMDTILSRPLSRTYSDYPEFSVRVETIEEILAQKLRALVQRKKVRDYYDVWRILQQPVDRARAARLFARKLESRGIAWKGTDGVFPGSLEATLAGYWQKELGRLVHPVPDMAAVLGQLKAGLVWLDAPEIRQAPGRQD